MAVLSTDLTIDQLLELPKEIRGTLVEVWNQVYKQKFTGPVTFHCHLGVPKTVTVPAPQIRLQD